MACCVFIAAVWGVFAGIGALAIGRAKSPPAQAWRPGKEESK